MDVIKLDSNFDPDGLIEGYETMIWTERYGKLGEFEMHTSLVEATRLLLPLKSYISLRDTGIVMIVEDHLIEEDLKGIPRLKVSGRTMESALDRRFVVTGFGLDSSDLPYFLDPLGPAQYPPEHAAWLIEQWDLPFTPSVDSSALSGDQESIRTVFNDYLDNIVNELLGQNDSAMRTNRLDDTVPTGFLGLEFYKGLDKSVSGAPSNFVILSPQIDEFSKISYLFTTRKYKNVVDYVLLESSGTNIVESVDESGNYPTVTGLNRYDMYFDALDISKNVAWGPTGVPIANYLSLPKLKEALKTTFVTSELISSSKYVYGTDYNLGDIITFRGDYGVSANLRIVEYIRIEDNKGERAFPTLATP